MCVYPHFDTQRKVVALYLCTVESDFPYFVILLRTSRAEFRRRKRGCTRRVGGEIRMHAASARSAACPAKTAVCSGLRDGRDPAPWWCIAGFKLCSKSFLNSAQENVMNRQIFATVSVVVLTWSLASLLRAWSPSRAPGGGHGRRPGNPGCEGVNAAGTIYGILLGTRKRCGSWLPSCKPRSLHHLQCSGSGHRRRPGNFRHQPQSRRHAGWLLHRRKRRFTRLLAFFLRYLQHV